MTSRAEPITFAADAMLGSLARWLRLLGYDCTYSPDADDEELVRVSRAEGRIVLTRDREVARNAKRAVFVAPGSLDDELTAVCRALSILPPEEPPAVRCTICNGLLAPVARGAAPPGVPARVVELGLDIWRCDGCSRHYWRGSHVDTMTERLRRVRASLGGPAPTPALRRAGHNG